MVFVLAACGGGGDASSAPASSAPASSASSAAPADDSSAAAAEGPWTIGFTMVSTQGDFLSGLASGLTEKIAAEGSTLDVQDAQGDVAKQIEQIENFTTQGYDAILIMPVEPTGLTDACQKAMDAGIKVLCFSGETEVYDLFFDSPEDLMGAAEAKMAAGYIDAKYADAEAGSVEVAIIENTESPTKVERSEALNKITEYTDKAKVVTTVEANIEQSGGQTAAETILAQYPEVKVILCYNGEQALGVNAFATAQNSSVDAADFGVFGTEISGETVEALIASLDNSSVYRGSVRMFDDNEQLQNTMVDGMLGSLSGKYPSPTVLGTRLYETTGETLTQEKSVEIDTAAL
jgi:ribose transport system substrate-binding protein